MFLFVHVFSSGGGANQRKLKQRRMAKRLQRERMKPFVRGLGAGALTKAHCLDEAENIGCSIQTRAEIGRQRARTFPGIGCILAWMVDGWWNAQDIGLSKPRQKHSNIGCIGACSWPVGLWGLTQVQANLRVDCPTSAGCLRKAWGMNCLRDAWGRVPMCCWNM